MATKKVVTAPKDKTAKKKPASKEKKVKVAPVVLTSYTISATIPTMAYGNIMPTITVNAPTIEVARDILMPHIIELYRAYAEDSRDGKVSRILANRDATVQIEPTITVLPKTVVSTPKPKVEAPVVAPQEVEPESETIGSAPYLKARKAIESCNSIDALNIVKDQVNKSVKLQPNEKDALSLWISKKASELNG